MLDVDLASGELTFCHGKSPFFNGKIHYKWPFSIAMLVHQRVAMLNVVFVKFNLLAGFNPSEKYESVGIIIFIIFPTEWKVIKIMFQSSRYIGIPIANHYQP